MDNKHTTDILKTRGEIKKGSNGTTPSLSQPKKPEYNLLYNTIKFLRLYKIVPKYFRFWKKKNKELTKLGALTIGFTEILLAQKIIKKITENKKTNL